MADSVLRSAMSPEVLDRSWRLLKNEHTPWSLAVSRDQLQQHLLLHLLRCREQVLDGSYRPQPLRQFPMRKPDGRQRVLTAQYLQDKLVQRALLIILEPRAEALFHDDSYAYRPNRSVNLALDKVRERVRIGLDWLVDADITKFFDSIPHKPLVKRLKTFVDDANAMKLIEKWLKLGAHQTSMLKTRRGIPQGSILSPLFCNLYLHHFDSAMLDANIPYVRFADDFLLFAKTRDEANSAMGFAAEILDQLGLSLHPTKTRVVRSDPNVVFLGEKLPSPSR
jgi:group II intron reverse transcriptase/maturase